MIDYHIYTGQSYTNGARGDPALSTTPLYPDNCFQVLGSADATLEGITYGSLTPLYEGESWDTEFTDVERPSSCLGYRLYEAGDPERIVVVATRGKGGARVAEIDKGEAVYNDHISRVQACVNENGATRVWAVHYMQGEGDQAAGTTVATYLSQLGQLRNDYNADCKAITGQTEDIPFIQDQMDGWTEYDDLWPRIGLAQLKAHRDFSWHTLVGPRYHLERANDGLHLINTSYQTLAAMHAKVGAIVKAGGTWEPVHPHTITRTGRFVEVKFHVPTGPLVFDTTTVAAVANMGFSFHDTADVSSEGPHSASIIGVEITAADTVTLELDEEPSGGFIAYGRTDRHGNLRDSDSLQNWGCHFYDPITSPFRKWRSRR